jgi:hypothetical protein
MQTVTYHLGYDDFHRYYLPSSLQICCYLFLVSVSNLVGFFLECQILNYLISSAALCMDVWLKKS